MDIFRKNGGPGRMMTVGCIILCIVLVIFMAGFLKWDSSKAQKEAQRLEKLNEESKQAESSGVQTSGQEAQTPDTENSEAQSGSDNTAEQPQNTAQDSGTDQNAQAGTVSAVSFWGNDFLMGNGTDQNGYPVKTQAQLAQQGYAAAAENCLLDSKSTLSILRYAGVAEGEVQAYIDAHRNAGAAEGSPEVTLRNFTQEELAREFNREAMPVLLMGYYGGYNGSTEELIQQQQKVLAALGKDQGPYLIVGLSSAADAAGKAAYDTAMSQAWGERYVSANGIAHSPETAEGQQEIAAVIADKLVQMGVLKKEA